MLQRQFQSLFQRILRRLFFSRWCDDDNDLALGFRQVRIVAQGAQGAAIGAFIKLGQLTAHTGFAVAQNGVHIRQRVVQSRTCLEKDKGGLGGGEVGQECTPRRALIGQEAGEQKPVGRQARQAQGRQHAGRAGDRVNIGAGFTRDFDQAEAGVGNQRRTGVGNLRDHLPNTQALDDFRQDLRAGVVVITQQWLLQAVCRKQLCGDAGVFRQHDIGGPQNVEGAQGNVAQIADRRGDDIEAWRHRPRRRSEQDLAHSASGFGRLRVK